MNENESKVYAKVPAKVSVWTEVKNFWLQPIVLELTPYQKKVFQEVHDFWNQEIYFDNGFHLRKQSAVENTEPVVETPDVETKFSL